MLKMTIDGEEVVSKNNFSIKEEMLSASSTILNNTYPKTWEQDHDYTSRFYYPKDYSKMVLNRETHILPEEGSNVEIDGSTQLTNVDNSKEANITYLKGQTSQAILPSAYKQVEYIAATGGQYINTGYSIKTNTRIVIDVECSNTGTWLYGTRTSGGSTDTFGLYTHGASEFWAQVGGNGTNNGGTFAGTVANRNTIDINGTTIKLNGTSMKTYTNTLTAGSKPLFIFGMNNGGSIDGRNLNGKIYSFKIYENIYLVRDYVPCYRNSDNVIGLYDLVNNQFYTNAGTGTFTKGADAPTPNAPINIDTTTGLQDIEVCGKNWFSLDKFKTDNQNATITGSADDFYFSYPDVASYYRYKFKENTRYQISGSWSTTYGNLQIRVYYTDGTSFVLVDNYSMSTASGSFNRTTEANKTIDYFRVYTWSVNSNITLKDFQIEIGTSKTSFEPYIGNSYEVNLGKNLLEDSKIFLNNALDDSGAKYSGASTRTTIYQVPVLPNTTYTTSCASGYQIGNIFNYNSSGTWTNTTSFAYSTSHTFTNSNSTYFISFVVRRDDNGNMTSTDLPLLKVQIEKGNQTEYAPYFTPIELCKIGNYQDFIRLGTGKNLFDKDSATVLNAYFSTGQTTIANNEVNRTIYIPCEPNTTYTMQKINSAQFYIGYTHELPANGVQVYGINNTATIFDTNYKYITFTTDSDAKYIVSRMYQTAQDTTITFQQVCDTIQIEKGNKTLYEPYNYKDKWYLHKEIGKVVFDENTPILSNADYISIGRFNTQGYTNIKRGSANNPNAISSHFKSKYETANGNIYVSGVQNEICLIDTDYSNNLAGFKTWLGTEKPIAYYILATPTTTEITNTTLINELESIRLLNGLNNITITSEDLTALTGLHYNYITEEWLNELIFSGIVKNTNNISLNPRMPKYCSLQILDNKTLLSEGNTLDYVINNKTILEAIEMVVNSISSYGFILGNVNILNGNEIIGTYSTENKTAYDVLQYLADISGAKWNCRRIDENTMAIDFYEPSLMPRGEDIKYTTAWQQENNIVDLQFNYGTRDYRNKQVILSDEVIGDTITEENIFVNGYSNEFILSNNIAKMSFIKLNGGNKTFATNEEKEMGIYADFYYNPGSNVITSNKLLDFGNNILVGYFPNIKGREVVQNDDEIQRLNTQLNVNGTISRFETRNDETDSNKLLAIGETYLRYKGEAEITLTLKTHNKDLYQVGQTVYFDAPISQLKKDYMVKSKEINIYVNNGYGDNLDYYDVFYTYTLSSSFNSEKAINWFDNQRNKLAGNISEGEFISRNIDINKKVLVIWNNPTITEITNITGDNKLNSTLESPINN